MKPDDEALLENAADDAQEVMTADEVAELLRVNRKTIYAAFKHGELPGRRIGGTIRFSRSRLLEWLAHRQDALGSPKV